MRLSVVIPAFNEVDTIEALVARVQAVDIDKELIIVDDGSTDGTREKLAAIAACAENVRVLHHDRNQGKGASLRSAFALVQGEVVIVQDADLEYDPAEYEHVIRPILQGRADVVFGSRFVGDRPHRVLFFWHSVGNRFLTLLSNMLTNLNLTDIEACYKAFRREVIQSVPLRENRFGFEPEITAKVAHRGCRIYEVGVSYAGRTYREGKKINWKDGVRAIWCILKYNLFVRE
jgi:glycosyltransferase involved in cell wall biosynthesis